MEIILKYPLFNGYKNEETFVLDYYDFETDLPGLPLSKIKNVSIVEQPLL